MRLKIAIQEKFLHQLLTFLSERQTVDKQ